jgi:membrane fusion protein, copper/silver efflux system
MSKTTIKLAALVAGVAAISGGIGYWLSGHHEPIAADVPAGGHTVVQGSRKVLYWYDPMVPSQHFDKPGKSPFMDMQLMPKYSDEGSDSAGVKIDPNVVQNLGVRWAKVERGRITSPITATATVQFNDRQVAVVQARSAGFVERVYARAPGDVIARGAPLADLLVPDWAGSQGEFLAMLKAGDPTLAQAAHERLKLLGMPADLIARVEKSGKTHPIVTIVAPIGGEIQTLDLRTGMAVSAGASLAKINGLASVWLEAAIPEVLAGRVAVSNPMTATFAAYPGESFTGKVIAVLPETNADSRTLRVRVELPNRAGRLKPGMFAEIRLDADAGASTLLIPSEAVIRTGLRNIVLIAMDGGRFQPVEVKLGQEADGKIAVLDGLSEGQRIITSGQFLIDSEASLKGVLTRLNGAENKATPATPAVTAVPLNQAVGKIESLKGDEITVSHGPVQSLGWGPMTMPFKLARPDMAATLKPGDRVSFEFREGDEGYVIEQLTKTASGP